MEPFDAGLLGLDVVEDEKPSARSEFLTPWDQNVFLHPPTLKDAICSLRQHVPSRWPLTNLAEEKR